MNNAVPARVVRNDHVYSVRENGCSSMKTPVAMSVVATTSIGPRRSQRGSA